MGLIEVFHKDNLNVQIQSQHGMVEGDVIDAQSPIYKKDCGVYPKNTDKYASFNVYQEEGKTEFTAFRLNKVKRSDGEL